MDRVGVWAEKTCGGGCESSSRPQQMTTVPGSATRCKVRYDVSRQGKARQGKARQGVIVRGCIG